MVTPTRLMYCASEHNRYLETPEDSKGRKGNEIFRMTLFQTRFRMPLFQTNKIQKALPSIHGGRGG